MIEEIPRWSCWHAEGLIPLEYGTLCLRALVEELNQHGTETLDAPIEAKLKMYSLSAKAASANLRCQVGGCEAQTPMTPELYQLISERSV